MSAALAGALAVAAAGDVFVAAVAPASLLLVLMLLLPLLLLLILLALLLLLLHVLRSMRLLLLVIDVVEISVAVIVVVIACVSIVPSEFIMWPTEFNMCSSGSIVLLFHLIECNTTFCEFMLSLMGFSACSVGWHSFPNNFA